jgi:hypothetical protein
VQKLAPPLLIAVLNELSQLQLSIATRAKELMGTDGGRYPERDFWHGAEREIWAVRLGPSEPILAG